MNNYYGKLIQVTADGQRFVGASYVSQPELPESYWGFMVDGHNLPVPMTDAHFRQGGQSPRLAILNPHNGTIKLPTYHEYDACVRTAQPIGRHTCLANLAMVVSELADRDVVDVNSHLRPDNLGRIVSAAVAHAAYDSRLIGGKSLDAEVRGIYPTYADFLNYPGNDHDFLGSWERAWTGFDGKMHGQIIHMTARVLRAMVADSFTDAVRRFAEDRRRGVRQVA
ncbi:MAG TPA: hypothetical protein VLA88_06305 [Candidatus Saccharimonadales bacterium]|nr:hypothetical protein [Candidatus Saccharimonadales bacterium]